LHEHYGSSPVLSSLGVKACQSQAPSAIAACSMTQSGSLGFQKSLAHET
jgi:hypothetical protein